MARPPKGAQALTNTVSVKVNARELALLERLGEGSTSKALRRMLNRYLGATTLDHWGTPR